MDVSIIIINYNTLQMTKECIDSVFDKTHDLQFEVILVDNASTDGSKDYFVNDKRIRYIYNNENLGFGRANNLGVDVAVGRNIIFLNSDTLLTNNAIKILSDYLDDNASVGACGGNLYDANHNPAYSYCLKFPSIPIDINLLLHNIPGRLLYKGQLTFNHTDNIIDVAFITGADLMVKRNVIDAVGCYNPQFFMYFEDSELCYRIVKAGYSVKSVPFAKIMHLGSVSAKKAGGNKSARKECMFKESRIIYHKLTNRSKLYIWFDLFLTSKFMKRLFFI